MIGEESVDELLSSCPKPKTDVVGIFKDEAEESKGEQMYENKARTSQL